MDTILKITNSDIGLSDRPEVEATYTDRYAARAVLFDADGRVALIHGTVQDYYKLPGGGIDEGEGVLEALTRELLEEVGATARICDEIGRVEEWREHNGLHQVSDAYEAHLVGSLVEPSLEEEEIAEGFCVVWAKINEAIELVRRRTAHDDPRVRFMAMRDAAILQHAKDQKRNEL
jgi:8-oxo-dGTP pyrophosphatase MutT (NUDIX family)